VCQFARSRASPGTIEACGAPRTSSVCWISRVRVGTRARSRG
jgi:hypothetical protein